MFLKVTYIHGIIHHALIQTANEVSTYSYIVSSLGLNELNEAVNNKTSSSVENVSQMLDNITGVLENVVGMNFKETKQGAEELIHGDFEYILKDFAEAVAMEVYDEGKTYVFNSITKPLFLSYIEQEDIFSFIEGGKDGIDFSQSRYFEPNEEEIIHLVANYQIKNISPISIIEYVPITQGTKIRCWFPYSQEEIDEQEKDKEINSIWNLTPLERHKYLALEGFMYFNLPDNFKSLRGFDKSSGEARTYISINLNDVSYKSKTNQIKSRLKSKLTAIMEFKEYTYEKVNIGVKDIKNVVYVIYIPVKADEEDKKAVYEFVEENINLKLSDGRSVNVEIKVEERE